MEAMVTRMRPLRWTPLAGAALALWSCEHDPGASARAVACATQHSQQTLGAAQSDRANLGREVAMPRHLRNGEEFRLGTGALLEHGRRLFTAVWTAQEGGGRPLTKGTGDPLTDPSAPLVFPRNFNRVSAPDANSCASCHSVPFVGGGGHFSASAFVPAQRFDFVTFGHDDLVPLRSTADERGAATTLLTVGNLRASLGMNGAGFIEMLARQITVDLQAIRDALRAGQSAELVSKGLSFGTLSRWDDGTWDVRQVTGLAASSLTTSGPDSPPSLLIRPFHQSGVVVSLREFTNNAFNHHHGIQSEERFGPGADPDGDGFRDEVTRADVTAAAVFQAALAVPGRVIPRDRVIEDAVLLGERLFAEIRCTSCHVPTLPLDNDGWFFTEPNPFNPPGNLRPGDAPTLTVDLTSAALPGPRLAVTGGVVHVPAYTDLRLHDITSGPDDPNVDPIDMQQPGGSDAFFRGTRRFLTRKLWGVANEPPYFHHGRFTTLRDAILAHAGEARSQADAFRALRASEQNAVIEFLKTLQVLPPGVSSPVVDENGEPRVWPPARM